MEVPITCNLADENRHSSIDAADVDRNIFGAKTRLQGAGFHGVGLIVFGRDL